MDELGTSIYYLKIEELDEILTQNNLSTKGSKQAKINRLLQAAGVKNKDGEVRRSISSFSRRKDCEHLDDSRFMLPGIYTNSRKYRERFKDLVGSHFSYTTYGMDWLMKQWDENHYPTFDEFAQYWQAEYLRRKQDKNFDSLKTNARVRFFRSKSNEGLCKEELEEAWQKERNTQAKKAIEILNSVMK